MGKKPTRPPKLRPDVNETAFRVLQEATGEAEKSLPPGQRPDDAKHPEAVRRGAKGGKRGGKVRARALTKERRMEIAQAASLKRWGDRGQ